MRRFVLTVDGLLSVNSAVDDQTITIQQVFLLGNQTSNIEQVSESIHVAFLSRMNVTNDQFLGDDQKVGWCLWINILEGQNLVVLIDLGSIQFSSGKLGEKCFGRRNSKMVC